MDARNRDLSVSCSITQECSLSIVLANLFFALLETGSTVTNFGFSFIQQQQQECLLDKEQDRANHSISIRHSQIDRHTLHHHSDIE